MPPCRVCRSWWGQQSPLDVGPTHRFFFKKVMLEVCGSIPHVLLLFFLFDFVFPFLVSLHFLLLFQFSFFTSCLLDLYILMMFLHLMWLHHHACVVTHVLHDFWSSLPAFFTTPHWTALAALASSQAAHITPAATDFLSPPKHSN